MHARFANRCLLALLALVLALSIPVTAKAAEEEVTGVSFIGYTKDQQVKLYTDDEALQLTMLAEIKGSSAEKDVTDVATWSSDKPTTVKVEKGKITVLKEGTALIKGSYKSYTTWINVTAVDMYNSLELSAFGTFDVELGDTVEPLQATVAKKEGGTEVVTDSTSWTTTNANVLTVDKGKVTLVGEGKAKVTAKYKTLSATVEYNVTSPYSKIELSQDTPVEMSIDSTPVSLEAVATNVNATTETITDVATWKSSNEAIVKVEKGVLTPVGRGSAKVTVQHLGKKAEIEVLVRLPYLAMELDPDKKELVYFLGEDNGSTPTQFNAYVMKNTTSKDNVTSLAKWTSSDLLVASVQDGKITVKGFGNAKISVSHLGLSKDIQLQVYKPLVELKPEKDTVTMFKKETVALPKVNGKLIDGETVDFASRVEWSSSNEDVAKVDNGKIVAGEPGKATLKGKLGSRTLELKVTVQEKVLALLKTIDTLSVVVGADADKRPSLPTINAVFEDGSMEENVNADMTWKISSPNVIIKDGKLQGLVAGRATLTGTYLNKTITIPVIMEDKITKLTIDLETIDLNFKRSKSIKVVGTYENGKTTTLSAKIKWTSSNEEIVTVKGSTVKALSKVGSATLTATYQDLDLSVKVNVTPKLTKLQADETRMTLTLGGTGKTDITALFEDGTYNNVNAAATWTSSRPTFVTVDGNGNIKAIKKGSSSIKATYNGKSVTISVTVK